MRATIQQKLSPRRRQLVELVADGYSNPEIAERMGITEGSCKAMLSVVYKRLGLQGWGNARVRLAQALDEQRAQYTISGYEFPVGL